MSQNIGHLSRQSILSKKLEPRTFRIEVQNSSSSDPITHTKTVRISDCLPKSLSLQLQVAASSWLAVELLIYALPAGVGLSNAGTRPYRVLTFSNSLFINTPVRHTYSGVTAVADTGITL
jgi:hypothetical protein